MEATAEITAAVKNVPALRFPEFEGKWKEGKLKGLIKSIDSGWSPQCEAVPAETDEWGVLKTTSVVWDGFNENENKRLPDHLEPREEIQVRVNDILITRAGPTNRVGVTVHVDKIRPKLMLSDKIVRLRTNDENNSKFIAISLASDRAQKQLMSKSSGLATSQTNISQSIILNTKLIYPAKEEQQKIASFLTVVDGKIQQLSKKKELLEKYKKGVMQQIFSQQIRFKDDNGNDFPEWEEKRLEKYITHKSERNRDGKVELVLSVSNKKGFITQDEQFDGYAVASKDLSNYKVVERNDIAYNPSRINVGSIARLTNFDKGIVSPMYVVFSLKEGLSIPYFEFLYDTFLFKHLIKVSCSGSVRDTLNFEDLCSFKLRFPSTDEQNKIAKFLTSIDNKINYTSKQLEQAQQFKKGLLQQMFV
ncbi:restriction endonuclease subunit S [Pontibacter fetidus]|uniref:Type I restriction modification DNA specificity domain-containing protein n=1 Tax=Pontibacter fetidus TaxID=2700082 RepID=A0A6B2H0M5_9BACT|nr:restriction endonuclease subunit S [Pontibacter fetidus]NDK56819.1 hypothetical protein [Pontibacter fetidus]